MTRLTDRNDGEGDGWFDMRATKKTWEEKTWFDGSNHISLATQSQWDHQALHLSRKGEWIISCSSEYQGTKPKAYRITQSEAAIWLIDNLHADAPDDEALSGEIRAALRLAFADSER